MSVEAPKTHEAQSLTLSIVIPAKNESGNIKPLIDEIRSACDDGIDYELIYVDDGSTDSTFDELKAIRDDGMANLRVIQHQQSTGQSTAIISGARIARGQWLVVLDADGQNDPADIPGMLASVQNAHEQNPQVVGVIGHRVNRRDDIVKRVSSKVANGFRDMMLRDGIPDTGCGLKAVIRERYMALPYFNHMHRYIPTLIQSQGFEMMVHPVNHRPRMAGTSNYGVWNRLWVGLVDVLGVVWLKRRAKVIKVKQIL
ncbi:glycosyltransferase family 2 protein [Paraferrimonas haliotis]|uniref:Dolichol-phosphate mannosyltransferase n=1 Tax=Paraferrimonas haliotis TaxID=2013866 RepID=A0AA37TXP8_9GAMM|nr:glycosyltransferase family 2 protein [Paraferrimonas haliotis]GLS84295.1 dolichol-phosphate mannosyltransferase [Paraferrimonas haliotis]